MPCLYLLCVGIDEYAGPVNSLNGCVNDAEAYTEYFKLLAHQRGWDFSPSLLTNADASRDGIISAFDHFDKATEEDFCIWTYSGHGSRCPAPPEFWHQNPDRKHRSIVCHDSRTENGSDLLDKELSWLIWKTTRKSPHFLILTDCCFSGQNLRLEGDLDRSVRFDRNSDPKPLQEYLGINDYKIVDDQYRSPPRGRYLQLAASHRDQPALERAFASGSHGLFTYKLLEELKNIGRPVSYRELFFRIKAAVSISCQKQAPQMDNYEGFSQQTVFLGSETTDSERVHWMYYNLKTKQWRINVGSTLGVKKGQSYNLEISAQERTTLSILRATPFYSIVEGFNGYGYQRIYPVDIAGLLPQSLTVAFAPNFPSEHKTELRDAFRQAKLEYTGWQEDSNAADCWVVHENESGLGLFARNEDRPLFQRQPLDHKNEFWDGVGRIARWRYTKSFTNPQTRLSNSSVGLKLHTVLPDGAKTEVSWEEPVRLPYASDDYDFPLPSYSLRITNTSQKTLHFSALFLSNTYAITNCLLEGKTLRPGEFTFLEYEDEDQESTIIPNHIEDHLWEYGVVENVEVIQLMVATVQIDTQQFNQEGLRPDVREHLTRSIGSPFKRPPDWTVFSIQLNTLRPHADRLLSEQNPVTWFSHRLEAPSGFTAQTNLYPISYLEELLGKAAAETITFCPVPYLWTPGFNLAPGLCLLRLHKQSGIVSVNDPLHLYFPEAVPGLRAFVYDSSTNTFLALPITSVGREVSITFLPVLTTSEGVDTGALILFSVETEA